MSIKIAIDIENTGLEPGDRMVEIAAVVFNSDNDQVIDEFETLVHPEMPIPPDAIKIHGITDEMVADAPLANVALASFRDFILSHAVEGTRTTLVSHNADFDVSVIGIEAARAGVDLPVEDWDVLCTLMIARASGVTAKNNLKALMEFYNIIRVGEAHRALSDAYATAALLTKIPDWKTVVADPFTVFAHHRFVDSATIDPIFPDFYAHVDTATPFTFSYLDAKDNLTVRDLTPYAIAMKENDGIYFSGLCHLRNARRTFRLDRVMKQGLPSLEA